MEYLTLEVDKNKLYVIEDNNKIIAITMNKEKFDAIRNSNNPLLLEASKQLTEYFNGVRTEFNLPLDMKGTVFQIKVWKTLLTIPYGEVCSYKDIAMKINHAKAYRAVGLANNKNPFMIVVPCHRVIGSNGSLVGYAGGLDMKKKLLKLEGFL